MLRATSEGVHDGGPVICPLQGTSPPSPRIWVWVGSFSPSVFVVSLPRFLFQLLASPTNLASRRNFVLPRSARRHRRCALMILMSAASAASFSAGGLATHCQVLRTRHVRHRSSVVAQLDHHGLQDLYGQEDGDKDDRLLAAIQRKLMLAGSLPIAMSIPRFEYDLAPAPPAEEEADACFLLPEDDTGGTQWSMTFMCQEPPEDNSNLVCEEQADGMGWICASRSHYGV